MKVVSGIVLLVPLPNVSFANDVNRKVDTLFSGIDKHNAPGCNVGVIQNGEFVYKAGHGLAIWKLE